MAWRSVHITEPARLSIEHGQLRITSNDGNVSVALEDLGIIVLDTVQTTISGAVLSQCMDHAIAIVTCDGKHLPNGLALPSKGHWRQAGVAKAQLSLSLPLRKQIWRRIVQAKIQAQAAALKTVNPAEAIGLDRMASRVTSGDRRGHEAQAARRYWQCFFADFIRSDEADPRNALLNYGYAVARGCVARAVAGTGLFSAMGVGHDGAANPFNLVDDLIEPFRPSVDLYARALTNDGERLSRATLNVEDRRHMAKVSHAPIIIGSEEMSLMRAAEGGKCPILGAGNCRA